MSDPFDDDDFPRGRRDRGGDFPFGNDFNEFFKYIQKMLENLLNSDFSSDFEKMFGDGDKPFVWGFSFNRGVDGKPHVEKFGNFSFNRSPEEPEHNRGIREPLTDLIEEQDAFRLITELPGVDKDKIDLHATETRLKLKASGDNNRIYKKELKFPDKIIPESAKAKFKNGVLEVVFTRTKKSKK